ncbi:MAG TPA: nucleoside 2-deoxyribosyltransferase [bacterium]|nr:nucleoside 2-deoxyribosyltransferase [bacterium]
MKVFLASPLGFMESSRPFISRLVEVLEESGHTVLDPWSLAEPFTEEQESARRISDEKTRRAELHRINMAIARQNHRLLEEADGILAVLDGSDVDSGTASEIGCAFGIGGKIINGYRGDFRRAGENDGCRVNLQVQYWIEQSGGRIYTGLEALRDCRWA